MLPTRRLQVSWPPMWQLCLLAATMCAVALAAHVIAPPPVVSGPAWASKPIVLAALLCVPAARAPAFLLTGLITGLAISLGVGSPSPVPLSLINITEVAAAAAILRSTGALATDLARQGSFWNFILVAVLGAPALAAVPAAYWMSHPGGMTFGHVLQIRFLTDAMGMLVVAPAALSILRGETTGLIRAPGLLGRATVLCAALAVSVAVFVQSRYPFLFLIPPPLIFFAARAGQPGVALFMPALAGITLFCTSNGTGPFWLRASLGPGERVLLEVAFIAGCLTVGRISAIAAVAQADAVDLLKHANERFLLATEGAGLGLWDWDVANDRINTDARLNALYGWVNAAEPLTVEGWARHLHRDDRARVFQELQNPNSEKKSFDLQFRIVRSDGGTGHIRVAGLIRRDTAGRATHFVGVNWDVTAQAVALAALHDSEERMRLLMIELKRAEAEERAEAAATQERLQQLARHLSRARDQAELASAAKTRFLANITHELRTPLNGILGYAQLLRLQGGLNTTQDDYVGGMLSAGEHLLGMINSVLDLSQIESGRIELVPVPVELRAVAQVCLDLVRPAALEKSLLLKKRVVPGALTHLVADKLRLRQVIVNLLGNAVKFTSAGEVELLILPSEDEDHVRLEIADTGPGISAEKSGRLFEEFARLGDDVSTAVEGSGLGLAITARLVARMGGTIGHVANPGGGSIFWVELPVGQDEAPMFEPDEVGTALAADDRKLNVLVVDDVEVNRILAGAMLQLSGHKVSFAASGAEAIAAAAAGELDVVLMDVRMPGMDGLEATRRIRALPAPRGEVPVVALTAQSFASEIALCREAGMDDHVSKPVDHTSLMAALARATEVSKTPTDTKTAMPADGRDFDEMRFSATRKLLPSDSFDKFIRNGIRDCEALRQRLLAPDLAVGFAHLVDDAHKIGGNAGALGLHRVARLARQFETSVDSGAAEMTDLVRDLIDALGTALVIQRGFAQSDKKIDALSE